MNTIDLRAGRSAETGTVSLVSADGRIVVPDAHLLFAGHYSRAGNDLVITGDDGETIIIVGYFTSDPPPDLFSPDGAVLTGDVVAALAGPLAPGQYAQATPPEGAEPIGQVEKLEGTTIGAVVRPSEDIVEIVPLDDSLLIEAKIRPQDVAFVRPDQKAAIKLTAYDYAIYGQLDGRVERISADTIADERSETFYRVILRTDRNYLEKDGGRLPIIPGMVARVDIQTGEKTVLDYLLKPILKVRHEALRER